MLISVQLRAIGGRFALGAMLLATCAMTACSGGVAYRSGSAPVYASQGGSWDLVMAAPGGTPDAGARSWEQARNDAQEAKDSLLQVNTPAAVAGL